tara:strand:- start:3022 stop:4005 length:984 start_codon:yes stop_codon:yes gene_type:complete
MKPIMTAKDAADFLNISQQGINKKIKAKEIPYSKSANRIFFEHEAARELFDLRLKSLVYAFQIVKGGTGKTAMALNFGLRASTYGLRVLFIDLDQQGNLTDLLGLEGDDYSCMLDVVSDEHTRLKDAIVSVMPGVDLVPSNLDNALLESTLTIKKMRLDRVYRTQIDEIKDEYDLVIIDCPPALGQSNVAAALASDVIIAPTDPDRNAIKGLSYTYNEISKVCEEYEHNLSTRIILNKFDKRTSLSHDTLESLIKHKIYGPILCKSYIGINQAFPNANAQGVSIFDGLKDSGAKTDIDLLVREVLGLDNLIKARKENLENTNTEAIL